MNKPLFYFLHLVQITVNKSIEHGDYTKGAQHFQLASVGIRV